jgi:hypothetical protein
MYSSVVVFLLIRLVNSMSCQKKKLQENAGEVKG